jgi:hypothetical protein
MDAAKPFLFNPIPAKAKKLGLLSIYKIFFVQPLTVSEEARIEPRTVETLGLPVILSNHSAGSHPHYSEGIEHKIKNQVELEVNEKML